jgi:hypothetical protein
VLFPPATAAILLADGARKAATTPHGWLVFGTALVAGATPPLVYTAALAREGRLFVRDGDARRSRTKVTRVAIPAGWLLGVGLVVASSALGGASALVLETTLGGIALGFWPGLLANFLRLRRDEWTR